MPRQFSPPIASPGAVPSRSGRISACDSSADLIRSRDNKWLKAFRAALRGGGPGRDEPMGVEGPKLVEEGLRARLEAEALLVSEASDRELERILRVASQTEAGISRSRILRTTDKLFASVAATETPQGVAALFRPREWRFEDVLHGAASRQGALRGDSTLVLVLAGVQDPGNVGTILRSAEAFGATGAIAARGTADPWSPKAVRASAGSALRLPLLRGLAVPVILVQLRVAGVKIYAATSKSKVEDESVGGAHCDQSEATQRTGISANLDEPAAIFIGSEGHGLPREVEHAADAMISIPLRESVESLNAAVAASVVLYEAARQRRTKERP
jgi:RNA methyltransferase, TrmH family